MKIGSRKDFFSGLLFIAVGGGFAWGATDYRIGEASRMGPGYFPLILGTLLALVGLGVLLRSIVVKTEDGDPVGAIAWKPMFFIILANLAFGVLIAGLPSIGIPHLGLMAAIIAVAVLASYAGDAVRVREVIILAIVLSVMGYVIFVWLLNLQLPAWPAFLDP